MSAERKEIFQPSPAFPLERFASERAAAWENAYLKNPGGVNASLHQLLGQHEHLYRFLVDMDSLRTLLSNRPPHNISYFAGSLVMLQAIENSYSKNGKILPKVNKESCEGYFNDLLDIENLHHEFEDIKRDLYIGPKQNLRPNDLYFTVANDLSDPKKVTRVLSALYNGSREQNRKLHQKEKTFFEVIIENRGRTLPRSYQYGALDVHGIFEQIETSESMRELMRKPINLTPTSFEDGFEL